MIIFLLLRLVPRYMEKCQSSRIRGGQHLPNHHGMLQVSLLSSFFSSAPFYFVNLRWKNGWAGDWVKTSNFATAQNGVHCVEFKTVYVHFSSVNTWCPILLQNIW